MVMGTVDADRHVSTIQIAQELKAAQNTVDFFLLHFMCIWYFLITKFCSISGFMEMAFIIFSRILISVNKI